MTGTFLSDIQTLRKRAREHIAAGAVTPGYAADRDTVVKLLNEAPATEIAPDFTPEGLTSRSHRLTEEILAKEEEHADDLATLLGSLGK